jgi:hypothetical protein
MRKVQHQLESLLMIWVRRCAKLCRDASGELEQTRCYWAPRVDSDREL